MTWNREQQHFWSYLFIVKFATIWLIKKMQSSHYEEQQLIEECTWENKCCSGFFHDFPRALWTWNSLIHNFIFCSVTHDLFHPAKKDLKRCTARAEMKEYRNDSLPPHSTPTFPKSFFAFPHQPFLDRNVFLLPCRISFSSSKNPMENASILTTAWPGWQLI